MLLAASLVLLLGLATQAVAGKPGGGKTDSSTLNLVLLESTDGLAHRGQKITFEVATTATQYPFVAVECRQSGQLVMTGTAGYYDGYPWRKDFTLSSNKWTSGGADCTARLYYAASNGREITLKTLGFTVYA